MRGMFGTLFKTNPYLERAVLTGILRVARESLFSGLNNVAVYLLLQPEYSQHFGFTEAEVTDLLTRSDLIQHGPVVKDWYNGYQMGDTVIYNPWSIVNFIKKNGKFDTYTERSIALQNVLFGCTMG